MTEDELLQQAHHDINDAMIAMAERATEQGRGKPMAGGGTLIEGDPAEAVDQYIRTIIGFEGDTAALLLGGVAEQLLMATRGVQGGAAPSAAMTGLFLSGFAHGKRFAELRELASREHDDNPTGGSST